MGNRNILKSSCIVFLAVVSFLIGHNNKAFAENEENIVPVLDLKTGIQQEESKEESPLKSWLGGDYATGQWGGLRTKLEDNGIIFSQSYMVNNFQKEHGGGLLQNSRPSYQGISSTSLEFNTEKMRLYKGGKLFVQFQNIHGKGLSDKYVGDYMYFNGYESTRSGPQLSEYWYEQSALKDKIKLKVGKQDANSEFQAIDTGFEFANSGFNFIVNSGLPTYPNAAVGLTATVQPIENLYFKYGFFDGSAVGSESGFNTIFHKDYKYINIEEIGITHSIKQHPGKLLVGFWQNTSNTEELLNDDQVNNAYEPITYKNNNGFYTEIEQMLFKENHDEEDTQGLTVMAQYAWAPKTKNELTQYSGVAMAYKGLLPKRNDDVFGVGANFARFSNRVGPINSGRIDNKGENVMEVFYKLQLTPWLYVQPDFQWINKPYYAEKSTIVFGVRTNITF
jgi:porin